LVLGNESGFRWPDTRCEGLNDRVTPAPWAGGSPQPSRAVRRSSRPYLHTDSLPSTNRSLFVAALGCGLAPASASASTSDPDTTPTPHVPYRRLHERMCERTAGVW